MTKVLIIEDDKSILLPLEDNLKLEGYETKSAVDGEQGLVMAREGHYDCILLDIMLPKLNGLEVCRQLRQDKDMTPILMLTAKSQEIDKVLGLELGADDYVTKPFNAQELVLRVEAVLRRVRAEPVASRRLLKVGPIELDKDAMTASLGGQPVDLTLLEYRLLETLLERRGRVQSRQQLLEAVWDTNARIGTRTVDMHVARLRSKLEEAGDMIETVRGVGYRIRAEANG
jgi:DNA-binding response OmpR family regulator